MDLTEEQEARVRALGPAERDAIIQAYRRSIGEQPETPNACRKCDCPDFDGGPYPPDFYCRTDGCGHKATDHS